ncbi:unnamed protein product [Sphagnum troendelagicum]
MLEEETQEDYKAEETPVVVGLVEAVDGGLEVTSEDELEEAGITHDAEESRAKLIDTIEELLDSTQDKIGAELVETTSGDGYQEHGYREPEKETEMEKVEDKFQERNEEDQRSNEQKDEPDKKNENIVSQQQADTLNLESVTAGKVEEDAVDKATLHKSSIQNELENCSTAGNKDSNGSRVELLGTNPVEIVFGKWMMHAHGRAEQLYGTLKRNSSLQVEEASADALLLCAYEASVKQRMKACCTDQPMDPGMGQIDASGSWMKECCWTYIIQDANGRQWEKSCRDLKNSSRATRLS